MSNEQEKHKRFPPPKPPGRENEMAREDVFWLEKHPIKMVEVYFRSDEGVEQQKSNPFWIRQNDYESSEDHRPDINSLVITLRNGLKLIVKSSSEELIHWLVESFQAGEDIAPKDVIESINLYVISNLRLFFVNDVFVHPEDWAESLIDNKSTVASLKTAEISVSFYGSSNDLSLLLVHNPFAPLSQIEAGYNNSILIIKEKNPHVLYTFGLINISNLFEYNHQKDDYPDEPLSGDQDELSPKDREIADILRCLRIDFPLPTDPQLVKELITTHEETFLIDSDAQLLFAKMVERQLRLFGNNLDGVVLDFPIEYTNRDEVVNKRQDQDGDEYGDDFGDEYENPEVDKNSQPTILKSVPNILQILLEPKPGDKEFCQKYIDLVLSAIEKVFDPNYFHLHQLITYLPEEKKVRFCILIFKSY